MTHWLRKPIGQIVLFAVLAFVWFLTWSWATDERILAADAVGQMDAARLELKRAQRDADRVEKLAIKFQNNQTEIQYLRDRFLTQKNERMIAISEALHQLGATYSVEISEVRYASTESPSADLELYRVELPIQGRYRDIRNFVNDIERSDLQLMVTQISVEESAQFFT